jgi:trans-aconitate methyltransferase
MAVTNDPAHWAEYNAAQTAREPRPLCRNLLELAGPGRDRVALDLGCGAGTESRALLAAGWRVHAFDSAPGTRERVLAGTEDAEAGRLQVHTDDLADLGGLPAADLVHAGYCLPWIRPAAFPDVWRHLRAALRPRAWLAVDLFGVRDSWAGEHDATFLAEREARALFDGLTIAKWDEEDADGGSSDGPKHWHVFHVIARREGAVSGR